MPLVNGMCWIDVLHSIHSIDSKLWQHTKQNRSTDNWQQYKSSVVQVNDDDDDDDDDDDRNKTYSIKKKEDVLFIS